MSRDDDRPLLVPVGPPSEPVAKAPAVTEEGTPEQLGFDLRFENGKAMLALENCERVEGVKIRTALFEVPDVAFPLDVTGGAERFIDKRLRLRALDMTFDFESLFARDRLEQLGIKLLRQRSRGGGVELLAEVQGPSGPVVVRARAVFVAAGDAGLATVVHEVIPFGRAHRPRLDLAQGMLEAIEVPGGKKAHGLVRRADVLRAVFGTLLPSYGWKVPAMGEVRIHEANLGRGALALRGWSQDRPDGWKKARSLKRGALEDAVALAVFADSLDMQNPDKRIAAVDALLDAGPPPAALVPFVVEVLRADERRKHEADDVVKAAVDRAPDHLGVLSAHVDALGLDDKERAARLSRLGEAADERDETWVSARAFLAAAEAVADRALRLPLAEKAWNADPTWGESGAHYARVLASADRGAEALRVGRQALERITDEDEAEAVAVFLAEVANDLEGPDAAKTLLRRALRKRDRVDALRRLIDIHIQQGELTHAAELMTRLLAVADKTQRPEDRAAVFVLSAELSEAQGERGAAKAALAQARSILPQDADIAVRQAALLERDDDLAGAIEALLPLATQDPIPVPAAVKVARLYVARGKPGDPERARAVLGRLDDADRSRDVIRVEAEALALMGDPEPLAELLSGDADKASTDRERAALLTDAARLFLRADAHTAAADVMGQALATGMAAVEPVVELFAEAPDALAEHVAGAFGKVSPDVRRMVSERAEAAGQQKLAHRALVGLDDGADGLRRATLARALEDADLERDELRSLVVGDFVTSLEADVAAAHYARLARLEDAPGGAGPAAAAAAFEQAHALGGAVVEEWLDAALRTGHLPALVGPVGDEAADIGRVPTEQLRALVAPDGPLADQPTARLRAGRVLAERNESDADVEAFLADTEAHSEPLAAADAFEDFGRRLERAAYLVAAAERRQQAGRRDLALAGLMAQVDGGEQSPDVLTLGFALAEEESATSALRRVGERLVDQAATEPEAEAWFKRLTDALRPLDKEQAFDVQIAWLNRFPYAGEPLGRVVTTLLKRGHADDAMVRLEAASQAGAEDGLIAGLVHDVIDAAEGRSVEVEARARQLAVGLGDHREAIVQLRSLVDLLRAADRHADAYDALGQLAARLGDEPDRAAVDADRARLARDQLGDPRRAAEAFADAVWADSTNIELSKEYAAALHEAGDHAGYARELARRSRLPMEPADRIALLVGLGDTLYDSLGEREAAVRAWIRAARERPASDTPFQRLMTVAEATNSHRLRVRAHIAHARALAEAQEAGVCAEEAAALLAGILVKPRLAIAAYRFAADRLEDPSPCHRALVELYRAVDDADGALDAARAYAEGLSGEALGLGLELVADVQDRMCERPDLAAVTRAEALELNPGQRTTALALERYLRDSGDVAGAIDVRRRLADAAEAPAQRAQTYAYLAEIAEQQLENPAFAAELAGIALEANPQLSSLRGRRVELLLTIKKPAEAADEIGALLASGALEQAQDIGLVRKKARIERESLDDMAAARKTLLAGLSRHPRSDAIVDDLVEVETALGEPAQAARHLQNILDEFEDGTELLGGRRTVLERIAGLLEDAGDENEALATLDEAAALGKLTRRSELRRARLAELREEFGDAVISLRTLLEDGGGDAEETVALLGRLAVAAEHAGQAEVALKAWADRAERVPNDVQALTRAEALGRELGDLDAARHAGDRLRHLEAGTEDERLARLLWLARDTLERHKNPGAAADLFRDARALYDGPGLRAEHLACLREAHDRAAAFALIEQMRGEGDAVPTDALLYAAKLLLEDEEDARRALATLVEAMAREDFADDSDLLSRIAGADPAAVAAEALTLGDAAAAPLVDAVCVAADAGATLPAEVVVPLADRFSDRSSLVLLAVGQEQDVSPARAADRLIALADAARQADPAGAEALLVQAAEVLAQADVDVGVLIARADACAQTWALDPGLRKQVLRRFRDAEAWSQVVDVLERAADAAEAKEARDLRLEAVAVLREGLGDHARAARHLEMLIEVDGQDRVVWGEYLETLEAADDQEGLVAALSRRIADVDGVERRELIRRKGEVLVGLGRGAEALPEVQAARADDPDDAELKALERELRQSAGDDALATFLGEELARRPQREDAETLWGLDAAPAALWGLAAGVMLDAGADPLALVQHALARGTAADRRVVLVAMGKSRGADLDAFLRTLGEALAPVDDQTAVEVVDGLSEAGVAGVVSRFGVAHVARTRRARGPWAARQTFDRFADAFAEEARGLVRFGLTARLEGAAAALEGLQAIAPVAAETLSAFAPDAQGLRDRLEAEGLAGVRAAAARPAADVAVYRAAHSALFRLRFDRRDDDERAALAEALVCRPMGPERYPLRLLTQRYLQEDARGDEILRIVDMAEQGADLDAAAAALDELAAVQPLGDAALLRRAELALARKEPRSARHVLAAAPVAVDDEARVALFRRAVEVAVQTTGDDPDLDLCLMGWVDAAGDPDTAEEVLRLAQAARRIVVVDELYGRQVKSDLDDEQRRTAVQRQATFRRTEMKDAQGAFDVLMDARREPGDDDGALADQAYRLAVEEGLTEACLEVVDDTLAEAGLLVLLGRRTAGERVLAAIGNLPSLYARAELALLAGDVDQERSVLYRIVDDERAGPEARRRLVELAERAQDPEEIVRQALAYLREFAADDRVVEALAVALDQAPDQVVQGSLDVIRRFALDQEHTKTRAGSLLIEAWSRASARAGSEDDALAALRALAEQRDDDASWGAYLRRVLAAGRADAFDEAVLANAGRHPLLAQCAADAPDDMGRALSRVPDEEARAILALADERGALTHPALQHRLVGLLQAEGKPVDAARALLRIPCATLDERRAQALRAAALLTEGRAELEAMACLLSLPLAAYDDDVRRAAVSVAEQVGPAALPLLVRVAESTAHDKEDVDRVLFKAMRTDDDAMAVAVAAWRLRQDPRDKAARNLVANRGTESARAFFGAALALDGEASPVAQPPTEQIARAQALRFRDVALDAPRPRPETLLDRARMLSRDDRRRAWRELAEDETNQGHHLDAARYLLRSGASLSDAPIDIRLAADPALADLEVRVHAVASAISEDPTLDAAGRSRLLALFSSLDDAGYAGADDRALVFGDEPDPGVGPLVDRLDRGQRISLGMTFARRGRHLSPGDRAGLAALALAAGQGALAAALHPGLRPGAGPLPSALTVAELSRREPASPTAALGVALLELATRGTSFEAERRIQALAEQAGAHAALDASLGRELRLRDGQDEAVDRWLDRARLRAEQLEDVTGALACARQAAALAPARRGAVDAWVRFAEVAQRPDELVAALEAREPLLEENEREEALLRRARVHLDDRQEPAAALALLAAAAERDPTEAVLAMWAECAEATGDRRAAAAAYRRAADVADDGETRAGLRRRAADHMFELGDREEAIFLLADSGAEGHAPSLDEAEEKARSLHAARALARVLEVRLDVEPSVEKKRGIALERARLFEQELHDRGAAIRILERQAVEDAQDLASRLALAEWYLDDRRILDAALAYESAASIPGLPAIAAAAPAREAACLLSALGDLERAGPLAERALSLGIADERVLTVATAFHRAHQNHARVDELLEKELELISDAKERAHLWMERARLRRRQLADADGARRAVHRVLELAPDHEEALAFMREAADETSSYGALRAALSRAAEVADEPQTAVTFLLEIATIDDRQFHDLRAAEASLDRALELRPDDASILVKKGELMAKRGNVDGLPAILERAEAAGVTDLPAMLQLVRGDALLVSGDRAGARAAFESATRDEEVGDRAWDRLLDVVQGDGEPDQYAAALRAAREASEDGDRIRQLAREEAAVWAEAGDEGAQLDALSALLDVEPGDTAALRQVRDLHFKRGRLERAEPRFAAWAEAATEDAERAKRLSEYGAFLLDEIGAEVKARHAFEAALDLDPQQPSALLRLAPVAYAARDYQTALELFDRIDPQDWSRGEADLLFMRADCALLLDRDDAQDRLRQVLRKDPKHVPALELMARQALRAGDHPAAEFALHTLSGLVDAHDDPLKAAKVFADLAELHIAHERKEDAVQTAERALELRPSAPEVLDVASRAYGLGGVYDKAIATLKRLDSILEAEDREPRLSRLAEYLERNGDEEQAVEVYERLYRLTQDQSYRERAALLEGTVKTPLPPPTPHTSTDGDAVDEPVLALRIQAQDLVGDHKYIEAVQLLRDAYDEGTRDAELARLGIVAARGAEDPANLVTFIEERLKAAEDQTEVRSLALEAGRAFWQQLAKPEKAAELLYLAHQADPENIDIRIELTSLYAEIPRLFAHAQTGVLQLLRRVPQSHRVYDIGAQLAARQRRAERARALASAAALLDPTRVLERHHLDASAAPQRPLQPLAEADIVQKLAPDGFGEPLQEMLRMLAPALEDMFVRNPDSAPLGRPLDEVSEGADALRQRLDALLPGREVRVLAGADDRLHVMPGDPFVVVLPLQIADADGLSAAWIARGLAVARLYGAMAELMPQTRLAELYYVLRTVLLDELPPNDPVRVMADHLKSRAGEAVIERAALIARDHLKDQAGLADMLAATRRTVDRFSLMASGSVVGALAAGPVPGVVDMPGPERAAQLGQSPRALDLLSFTAKDNMWILRTDLGLSEEQ